MTEKKITTKVRVYSYNELTEEQKFLVDLAREATSHSYSPYSNFKVGAALKLDNGEVFIGANQENAAFAGICGERAALYAAGAKYPGVPVKTVVITSFTRDEFVVEPTAPCGVCRQVMSEFCDGDFVIMTSNRDMTEIVIETLDQMMPHRFGPKDLL